MNASEYKDECETNRKDISKYIPVSIAAKPRQFYTRIFDARAADDVTAHECNERREAIGAVTKNAKAERNHRDFDTLVPVSTYCNQAFLTAVSIALRCIQVPS